MGWLVTTLALIAKTFGNVGWYINYVQNMEIFPTCARVTGMNLASTVSLIIGTVGPYVILLVSSLLLHDLDRSKMGLIWVSGEIRHQANVWYLCHDGSDRNDCHESGARDV